ncbi:hypothetical protein T4E_10015 [Trichinella pseudospiralis]|uniref:Uncharacterized protein n=1 Tax=Trichinella pseudospiralis TaxID=6337 RepID=A0A0V0YM14_TRIPS|nr:hypothetical protein T4E_10015 [Trichinella pseudospiralis]
MTHNNLAYLAKWILWKRKSSCPELFLNSRKMNSQSQYFMFHNGERPALSSPAGPHHHLGATAGPHQQWDWYRNCVDAATAAAFPFSAMGTAATDRSTQFILPNLYSSFNQSQAGPTLAVPTKDNGSSACMSTASQVLPGSISNHHPHPNLATAQRPAANFPMPTHLDQTALPSSMYFPTPASVASMRSFGGNDYVASHVGAPPMFGTGTTMLDSQTATMAALANHCNTNFYGAAGGYSSQATMHNACVSMPPPSATPVAVNSQKSSAESPSIAVLPQHVLQHQQQADDVTLLKLVASRGQLNSSSNKTALDLYSQQQQSSRDLSFNNCFLSNMLRDQQQQHLQSQSYCKSAASPQYAFKPAEQTMQIPLSADLSRYAAAAATAYAGPTSTQQLDYLSTGASTSAYSEQNTFDAYITRTNEQNSLQPPPNMTVHEIYANEAMQSRLLVSSSTQQQQQQQRPKQRRDKAKRKEREIAEVDQALDRHLSMLAKRNEDMQHQQQQQQQQQQQHQHHHLQQQPPQLRPVSRTPFVESLEQLKAPLVLVIPSSLSANHQEQHALQQTTSPIRFSPIPPACSPSPFTATTSATSATGAVSVLDRQDEFWPKHKMSRLYLVDPLVEVNRQQDSSPVRKPSISKVPVYKKSQKVTNETSNDVASIADCGSPYSFTEEEEKSGLQSSKMSTNVHSAADMPASPAVVGLQERLIEDEVKQKLLNICTLHPELKGIDGGSGATTTAASCTNSHGGSSTKSGRKKRPNTTLSTYPVPPHPCESACNNNNNTGSVSPSISADGGALPRVILRIPKERLGSYEPTASTSSPYPVGDETVDLEMQMQQGRCFSGVVHNNNNNNNNISNNNNNEGIIQTNNNIGGSPLNSMINYLPSPYNRTPPFVDHTSMLATTVAGATATLTTTIAAATTTDVIITAAAATNTATNICTSTTAATTSTKALPQLQPTPLLPPLQPVLIDRFDDVFHESKTENSSDSGIVCDAKMESPAYGSMHKDSCMGDSSASMLVAPNMCNYATAYPTLQAAFAMNSNSLPKTVNTYTPDMYTPSNQEVP